MSLWSLIRTGGWTMFPLFLCSLAVWGVVAERIWTLRRWRERNHEFLLAFSNKWIQKDISGARKLCDDAEVELALLAAEMLDAGVKPDKLMLRLERRRQEVSSELKRFLWVLGTIGSSAPFIGLFGTVVGIIKSFESMASAGTGGFAVVAAGISEALVATAAGILVAVIAVIFYNYFQVRVAKYQFQLKLYTEELTELWGQGGEA